MVKLGTLGAAALSVMIGGLLLSANAQQTVGNLASGERLPDAPGVAMVNSPPGPDSIPEKSSATISGTVVDKSGSQISGANVVLAGAAQRVQISDDSGGFTFSGLPAGEFKVNVSGPGMGIVLIPDIVLHPGEVRLLTSVVLSVAESEFSVRVVANQNQLAEEQVHLELQQRVFGVFPNFYSSYDWDAVPLGPKQKFQLAFRATTDPLALVGAASVAGAEQIMNTFPGYGHGAQGYAKRFGAAYANDATGRLLSSAILPSLLHQDPRYFYKGSGSIRSRALYAISSAVICRGDNGRLQPDYSRVLGNIAAGGISNLYYPSDSRGASLTILNGLIETAGNAGTNLFREFLLRGLTTKVPSYENGKP